VEKIKFLFYKLKLDTGNKAKAATSSTGSSDKLYYEAYSEINARWASVGSPLKMATWHWHSTKR